MDDTSQEQRNKAGAVEKKHDPNDLAHYLAAEKEEEAWLERMQAATKAQKAKEETENKTES